MTNSEKQTALAELGKQLAEYAYITTFTEWDEPYNCAVSIKRLSDGKVLELPRLYRTWAGAEKAAEREGRRFVGFD